MLGQHPALYGLPELNLFMADRLAEVMKKLRIFRPQSLHGLLRVVAQLEYQAQKEKADKEKALAELNAYRLKEQATKIASENANIGRLDMKITVEENFVAVHSFSNKIGKCTYKIQLTTLKQNQTFCISNSFILDNFLSNA